MGYPHSDQALHIHLEAVRGKKPAELAEVGVPGHFSAKKAIRLSSPLSFLLMCQEDSACLFEKQQEKEQKELQALRKASKTMELVQEFFVSGASVKEHDSIPGWAR